MQVLSNLARFALILNLGLGSIRLIWRDLPSDEPQREELSLPYDIRLRPLRDWVARQSALGRLGC